MRDEPMRMRALTLRPSASSRRIVFAPTATECEVVFFTDPLTECAATTGSEVHASVPSRPEPQPAATTAAAQMQARRFIRARNVLLRGYRLRVRVPAGSFRAV